MAHIDNKIEAEYSDFVGIAHRKRFAQFFTPVGVAKVMVEWLLKHSTLSTVLEPAFGLGIFSRILLQKKTNISISGFDIDEKILNHAIKVFGSEPKVTLEHGDYIDSDWDKSYDGIICNPPYFKFHDYDNKRCVSAVRDKINLSLSMYTNIYALFLIKSLHQLSVNGRCAYVVPAEFLNSDYGVKVKEYLRASGMLRHVIVFDFKDNLFDDALTTSAIVLCANDTNRRCVGFTKVDMTQGLPRIRKIISRYPDLTDADRIFDIEELDCEIKWKNYYNPIVHADYKHLVPFRTYGKVMRGIATGANSYFSFNRSKAKACGIDARYLRPCICHSADISGISFNERDFENLLEKDKNVLIFHPTAIDDNAVERYVRYGEEREVSKRFLTSKRTPWYSLEKRDAAPIWVGVFNRKGLKFVRNETTALNLTTFHCIYVHNNILGVDADLLFAYLISNIAKHLFASSSREYGNGLTKFEPNDINKSMMLDLGLLDEDIKEQLRNLYRLNKRNQDSAFVTEIDRILLEHFS